MARTPSTMLALGTPAPAFDLPDAAGDRQVSLDDFTGRPLLIAVICNHCPYVVHIKQAFAGFASEYQGKGLEVVAVNANDPVAYPADSPERMAADAQRFGYTFPYLFDESQRVVAALQAACTPEFFLFDADHRLVYRGQFDDSRPGNDRPVSGADLRAAADALLAGAPISAEQKPSVGCSIKWKAGKVPAYLA